MIRCQIDLVTDVNRAGADDIAQFARIESCHQFALTVESRDEFVDVADHLSWFHVTVDESIRMKINELGSHLVIVCNSYRYFTVCGRIRPGPSKVNSHSVNVTEIGFMKLNVA